MLSPDLQDRSTQILPRAYARAAMAETDGNSLHARVGLSDRQTAGFEGEVYAVIAIFGVEYVINLGGPELDGYEKWRKWNGECSYLYK